MTEYKPLPKPPSKVRGSGVVKSKSIDLTNDCDFNHWSKMERWTLEEAHFLSFGVEPSETHVQMIGALKRMKGLDEEKKNFLKLWQLIERAYQSRAIFDPIRPSDFIKWINKNDLSFPETLKKLVVARHKKEDDTKPIMTPSTSSYTPPYISFMMEAVMALGLTADKRTQTNDIKEWLDKNWPADLEGKSDRIVKSMVTLLRRPEDKKGGNTSWK